MAAMLDRLTVEDFSRLLGRTFRLLLEGNPALELVLVEARSLSPGRGAAGPRREPFSLVFRGPASPILPQRIYPLENEALGRLEIFLVPIEAGAEGVKYEAVFN
ncbi:MAG TPA: hypothetical protein VKH43_01655 [Thermoanaerobaculia bacterium]|nr:hypothetical protein [Thermoanaerobaculia bacterium]